MSSDDFASFRASVHSVLVTFKGGTKESEFCNVYRQCNGEAVPLRRYGFSSVYEMMIAFQDVVNITRTANGTVIYSAKVLGITKDLQNLVKSTKSKKNAKFSDKKSYASSVSSFRGSVANYAPRITADWNLINGRCVMNTAIRPSVVVPSGFSRPTRPPYCNQPSMPSTIIHTQIRQPPSFSNRSQPPPVNANARISNPVVQNAPNGAFVSANRPTKPVAAFRPSTADAAEGRVVLQPDVPRDVFRVRILEVFTSNIMIVEVELRSCAILIDYIRLLADMLAYYENTEPHTQWLPKSYEFVAVGYIGMWFRGASLGPAGCTMSTVLLCDIGKIVCLENSLLRRLDDRFLSLPQRTVFLKITNALSMPVNHVDKMELLAKLTSVVEDRNLEAKLPTVLRDSFFGCKEVTSDLAFPGWVDVEKIPAVIKMYCKDRKDDAAEAVKNLFADAHRHIVDRL